MEKFIYAGNPDKGWAWKFIPNTQEARKEALDASYNAFTPYSFEFEPPEKHKINLEGEPMRYGDLWLDIDDMKNPVNAILIARDLLQFLASSFRGFDLKMVKYYLSGAKGCHICIPAKMFGGEVGAKDLPLIHKDFLRSILYMKEKSLPPLGVTSWGKVDLNLYKMGKGHLLREVNVIRKDNRYKVQISAQKFFEEEPSLLLTLTDSPQTWEVETTPPELTDLAKVFRRSWILRKIGKCIKYTSGQVSLSNCQFVMDCALNQREVSEEEWFLLMRILQASDASVEDALEFSMDYPGYSEKETRAKFEHSGNYSMPKCEEVAKMYNCPENCHAKGWQDTAKRIANKEVGRFFCQEDGLYMEAPDAPEGKKRIGSPLKVLGRIKNPDGNGWGRLIELESNDHQKHVCTVATCDYVGKGEAVLAKLCDLGFEPAHRHFVKYVLDYIATENCEDTYIHTDKIGWYGTSYILPDKIFGKDNEKIKIFFKGNADDLGFSGTLQDWQENIGKYCQGNSLLMFCVAYALSGVLLQPCNMEPGGLHILGPSSIGKTTDAYLVASICGNPNAGYVNQWKMTANALEIIAFMRNDNILILDELAQATAEDVSKVCYMLPNGQGGGRMSRDITLRKILHWSVNFFSTGEMSVSQKIESTGKLKAFAGQEVRVINLPVKNDKQKNIVTCLHGFSTPAELMDHIKKSSKKYYGTPLRSFLEALFQGDSLSENIGKINAYREDIEKVLLPENASSQVQRVCTKFAQIAAAGKFACENHILPWSVEEMEAACKEWFEIWVNERGSLGDLELDKAVNKILKFIEEYGDSKFLDKDTYYSLSPIQVGYKSSDSKGSYYYFIPSRLREISGYGNLNMLAEELQKRGLLMINSSGKKLETISRRMDNGSKSIRVIGIVIRDIISNTSSLSKDNIYSEQPNEIIIDDPF